VNFWDTSAIVPLLLTQPRSDYVAACFAESSVMLVWWGASAEFTSAICRLERESRLSPVQVDAALEALRGLASDWYEVQPSQRLRRSAERLLRVHRLRASDSLQLAAAIAAAEGEPESLPFLSFDTQLNRAATREGFKVLSGP